ncbi:General transcription and DNA repair factor IIH subunit TFB5 [Lachnellula arida]|uniref:General transcription and DNA repair factor IIH subunit TFB5 n=2 Tax=Lachnellula TaxID=47830 RepID=A0A8T9BNN2_9HELO|nr:General transcription and DNA repair factor IIH subunit TFB5 [Lachnellula arida]TVY89971.1 General transcription and DNA repair factor IIH subunit [Lachnellula willkommii]
MPRAIRGVLVECDPSIKSIIVKIDSEEHAFIVEDLDDQTLVIKENMLSVLKMRLDDALKETQQPPSDSGSD